MPPPDRLASLLSPFRSSGSAPVLPQGYNLIQSPEADLAAAEETAAEALNRLLLGCDERPRSPERWCQVLERSTWHLGVKDHQNRLVGFLRATSDLALNANLWDLLSDPADPGRDQVITSLVRCALGRLRRELAGCSVSLSAPPEALEILTQAGFVVDPGGIRAMGLDLTRPGLGQKESPRSGGGV
jgi:hypothetical protein